MQIAPAAASVKIDVFIPRVRPPDHHIAVDGLDAPEKGFAQRGIDRGEGRIEGSDGHIRRAGELLLIRAVAVDALRRGGDAQRQPRDEQQRAEDDRIPNDQNQPQHAEQHAPDTEQEKARFAASIQRGDFRQLILHPPDGILRPRRRILRRDAIPKKAHRVADAGVYPPDHRDKRQRERQPNADGRNQAVARPVGNIQRQQEKQNGVEHKAKPLEANLAQHPQIPLSNEANVLRFDGARRFQPAYFLPFGLPLAYSHHARRVQLSQAGFRAAHTRRP